MFRGRNSRGGTPRRDAARKTDFESPMEELNYLLDRMDLLIRTSMEEYIESIRPPSSEPRRKPSMLESLKSFRNNRTSTSIPSSPLPTPPSSAPIPEISTLTVKNKEDARFLPMPPERVEEFVETIRRVAELVIIGERSHAKNDQSEEAEQYLAIFETFFERQGLATITNILTGVSFDLNAYSNLLAGTDPKASGDDDAPVLNEINVDEHNYMLLPPLPIATQAIQSVSILVQNVSRATSLFFLLSNNHVNELINFPLQQYHIAERRKHNQDTNGFSPRGFNSPELAELTTHFVTFLKSLALRMNAETLQFFLTYPAGMPHEEVEDIIIEDKESFEVPLSNSQDTEDDEERPMDEVKETKKVHQVPDSPRPVSIKTVKIIFPLYERALEFCSVHQDSFVRVTAMNICLNTLRLATVIPSGDEDEDGAHKDLGKSPDGVLHNAKPLPLKERVSIAQYVCTPSRVERLASPIFTKLAQLWGVLEEQFREMDTATMSASMTTRDEEGDEGLSGAPGSSKVARAKEKARRQKYSGAFNDTAYNVQDELLLLDDVLKVGLTSLNEQAIEMMFATFVYPLLLQPLLLYFQRSGIPDDILFADPLQGHKAGKHIVDSDMTATETAVISAPAKSALFFLTSAFQFLSNRPLLRLLFTALFHPMAPEATGETMIRAKADVACMSPDGKVQIRIDLMNEMTGQMKVSKDRSTYAFGTITGKKCMSSQANNSGEDETSCVFVLAPALAEILEFKGADGKLVARTRHNPYRKAIFQCFSLCSQLSGLQPLSVMAVEAGVSKFPSKFLTEILFGLDLKRFQDTISVDKTNVDKVLSRLDDRGIGGGATTGQSRLSLVAPLTGDSTFDHMSEVLCAFQSATMKAVPAGKGTWRLKYDPIAVHALLQIIRGDSTAIADSAKGMHERCRQSAAFLSDISQKIERFGESKLAELVLGSPKAAFKDLLTMQGLVTDCIFRGYGNVTDCISVINDFVELKEEHLVDGKSRHTVAVSNIGSYTSLCDQCASFPPLDSDSAEGALKSAVGSARAWVQLDAFTTMLDSLVETGGTHLRDKDRLGGFVVKRDGSLLSTYEDKVIYAHVSDSLTDTLFSHSGDEVYVNAKQGEVVGLVGHVALPCVCEVPPTSASLFSEASAKVVSQGITWQSLYLVILGRQFLLAEPEKSSRGNGRVITVSSLERLTVSRDAPNARADTAARRLIVTNANFETTPPGLFLFEEMPKVKDTGPFVRKKQWKSALDVWFEDNRAVSIAFKKVNENIVKAKVYRGMRIHRYLAEGGNTSSS